jgi:hypothetical protein
MEKQIKQQIADMLDFGNYPTELSDITFKDDFFYYEINYKLIDGKDQVTVDRYLMTDDAFFTWQKAPFQDPELEPEIVKTFLEILHDLEAELEAENEIEYSHYDPDEKHDEYKLNNN